MKEINVDSIFNSYERYGLKHFKRDIADALESANSPQQLGAYIAAAKKAYKAQICIDVISEKDEIDWTPTLAVHIISGIMGRAVSRKRLMAMFATSGRTAASKSVDFAFIDIILEEIKPKASERLDAAESDMETIISNLKDSAFHGKKDIEQ